MLRPPYRYGLHADQTGFLLTGHSGYFPAGVPGVFAFPVRREEIIPKGTIRSQDKNLYRYILGTKKPLSGQIYNVLR